jgi:hypothetical protein
LLKAAFDGTRLLFSFPKFRPAVRKAQETGSLWSAASWAAGGLGSAQPTPLAAHASFVSSWLPSLVTQSGC